MSLPTWWKGVRYGLHVHASLASVPAFAPRGAEAGWYHRHLGADQVDGLGHPSMPLVEVLAHHRDRWGFVGHYDDFGPLLTFEHFDADQLAGLAAAGGMGILVMSARHHDGFCWWDAPGTGRASTRRGPGRNVVDELSGACERRGIRFGTSYSLARGATDDAGVDMVRPQVLDLVERYRSELLWALDAGPAHDPDGLVGAARGVAARGGLELVVNDGWGATDADATTTFRHEPPAASLDVGWTLSRPFGWSCVVNRAERPELQLSAAQLVALLTETVAKGGLLLLDVGLDALGMLPRQHVDTIGAVGAWLAAHPTVVEGSRPFTSWGDADVRYTLPASGTGEMVHAVDVRGVGRFAALHTAAWRVRAVRAADGTALVWGQDGDGLHVTRLDRTPPSLAAVYEVDLEPVDQPVTLFEGTSPPVPLAPLLSGSRPGDVVRLGEGRYGGPATIPAEVSVLGAGPDRTTVVGSASAPLTLARGARVADLTVAHPPGSRPPRGVDDLEWFPEPAGEATIVSIEGDGASMTRVTVEGAVRVLGASGVVIDGCSATGITGRHVDCLSVRGSSLSGADRPVGIDVSGGSGHRLEGNDVTGRLGAILIHAAAGVAVLRNRLRGRWWGVRLDRSEAVSVTANLVDTTMRAVDVVGGMAIEVAANVAVDGDSGCIVEAGAAEVTVVDNRWERCRIGLLVWDAPGTYIGANRSEHLTGDAVVIGPDLT